MHLHLLLNNTSILDQFLYEIRDKNIQKDPLRFRKNIERIGEILGYELSKSLEFSGHEVETPLSIKKVKRLSESIVICSILRAGLPLHQGLLNVFDRCENAFVSAFRNHKGSDDDFEIITDYIATPNLNGKTLILADPMLATGQSIMATLTALSSYGQPKHIHLVSVIGSKKGVDYVSEQLPKDSHLWIGDIDPILNDKSYIVPGLGDAGDLSFGEKLKK